MGTVLPPTAEVALLITRLMASDMETSDDDSVSLRVGETVCQRASGGRPRNKVVGFGDADVDAIDEILEFYDEADLDPTFYLSPAGFGPRTATTLASRGFGQVEFEQAHMFGLPATDATPPSDDDITVAAITADAVDAYVETTAYGFEWDAAWRDAAKAELHRRVTVDDTTHLLASYRGIPAGVGDLRVRDQVATMGGGAVRPEFRRRGIHTALLRHRLALATQAGAELVLSGASYGSPSHRNQQRVGLQLAYVESTWARLNQ